MHLRNSCLHMSTFFTAAVLCATGTHCCIVQEYAWSMQGDAELCMMLLDSADSGHC